MKILKIFKKEKEEKETYLTQTGLRIAKTTVPTEFAGNTPESEVVWERDLYSNKHFVNTNKN